MPAKLDILLILDLPSSPTTDDHNQLVVGDDYKDEVNVRNALERMGHRVRVLGIFDDVAPLIHILCNERPDLAFVMCESFAGKRGFEEHIVGLLRMYDIPHTGGSPENLSLCRDKALTKKVLQHHKLRVPQFQEFAISDRRKPDIDFFPAICKPLGLEASEGISGNSLVRSTGELRKRIAYIHRNYGVTAIAEEFIAGDEYYVAVLGHQNPRVFPPRILKYTKWPKDRPKIFGFQAKWNRAYRKRWGIDSHFITTDKAELKTIERYARDVYLALGLQGYARLDLRMDDKQQPALIEANPNPAISRNDDFALAALRAGVSYDKLIQLILKAALKNHEKVSLKTAA